MASAEITKRSGPVLAHVQASSELVSGVLICSHQRFGLVWTSIIVIHLFTGVAMFVVALTAASALLVYGDLNVSVIDIMVRIGVHADANLLVGLALLDGGVAFTHFVSAFRMIYRSGRSNRLVFHSDRQRSSDFCNYRWWRAITAPSRAAGVHGRYFEVAFVVRELLEVASQSFLCFWISKYVSRVWINRFAVFLLVLNCWSTPLLHLVARHRHMRLISQRAFCLAVDVVLDALMASLLPMIVVLPYFLDFFYADGAYTPKWIVEQKSDILLILPSWQSMAAQTITMLSTVQALSDIKMLVRQDPTSLTKHKATAIVPLTPDPNLKRTSWLSRSSDQSRRMKVLDLIFCVWGVTNLAIHFSSISRDSNKTDSICLWQRHPWFAERITCEVVVIDCHRREINGSADDIQFLLAPLALDEIGALAIAHCPELSMPESLTQMQSLLELIIYNSTFVSWDDSTAISGRNTPFVYSIYLNQVNVDAVGNTLPSGLVSPDDPPTPINFVVNGTNLSLLESSFGSSWRHEMSILALEQCQLSAVTEDMATMNVKDRLSLAGNRELQSVPATTFLGSHAVILDSNNALTLPSHMNFPDRPRFPSLIAIQNTTIDEIPTWIYDARVSKILAWNSPICANMSSRLARQTKIECDHQDWSVGLEWWIDACGLRYLS